MSAVVAERITTTGRAGEAGHWYDRRGQPVYDIERSDGKGMRPVTLRDARKLRLLPGVSSIVRCAAAPGLEKWKQNQVLLAALTLPKLPDEKETDWIERVWVDSKAQAAAAAEKGKAVHAAIEDHFKGIAPPDHLWVIVKSVRDALYDKFGLVEWEAEKSFAHSLGYGGKRDLRSKTGLITLDFKTKEFGLDSKGKIDKELAWDENLIQLCGYTMDDEPEAVLANVFVSVSTPGLVYIHTWDIMDRGRGNRMFKGLLHYWQAKNNYDSGW
jgi:hypothetical protein